MLWLNEAEVVCKNRMDMGRGSPTPIRPLAGIHWHFYNDVRVRRQNKQQTPSMMALDNSTDLHISLYERLSTGPGRTIFVSFTNHSLQNADHASIDALVRHEFSLIKEHIKDPAHSCTFVIERRTADGMEQIAKGSVGSHGICHEKV